MKIIFALFFCFVSCAYSQTIKDYEDFIKQWEGKRNIVYTDSTGNKTIGIGHKLKTNESFIIISDKTVYTLFRQDVANAICHAKSNLKGFDSLSYNAKLIIVDMNFNLGKNGFSKFKKMIAYLQKMDYISAKLEMKNSLWYKQTGKRAKNHVSIICK